MILDIDKVFSVEELSIMNTTADTAKRANITVEPETN